jgi:Dyp-type peroxidase family
VRSPCQGVLSALEPSVDSNARRQRRDRVAQQTGIRPNDIIKDARADAFLFLVDLKPDLDAAGAQAFLQALTAAKHGLEADLPRIGQVATSVVALGPSFFLASGASRFGLDGKLPADFNRLPEVPGVEDAAAGQHDLLVYVMSTSEAAVADFERALAATGALSFAVVERGFQRRDHHELFGFRDGIRNVAADERPHVIYVSRDEAPDEPVCSEDGSYLAYLKIEQHPEAMAALAEPEQEAVVGRDKDGRRLDLEAGVAAGDEPEFSGDDPPASSHVRKAGPRGALHDSTLIFRRGVPYVDLHEDGTAEAGLQFVSFQRSLDYFDTIFNRWMSNDAFPVAGTGVDRLLGPGGGGQPLVSIHKAGFYFVPPADPEFIGACLFKPTPPPPHPRGDGRIVLRKSAVDANGQRIKAELGGAVFQVFRADDGAQVTEPFTTDSAGHATSPDTIPLNVEVVVREVQPPTPDTTFAEEPHVTLTQKAQKVDVVNRVTSPVSGYNG